MRVRVKEAIASLVLIAAAMFSRGHLKTIGVGDAQRRMRPLPRAAALDTTGIIAIDRPVSLT